LENQSLTDHDLHMAGHLKSARQEPLAGWGNRPRCESPPLLAGPTVPLGGPTVPLAGWWCSK
jgi:hypothetical protein